MIATAKEIEEIKAYYSGKELPNNLKLNAATTLTDVRAFVNSVIRNLDIADISEAALKPRYNDLLTIRRLIEGAEGPY